MSSSNWKLKSRNPTFSTSWVDHGRHHQSAVSCGWVDLGPLSFSRLKLSPFPFSQLKLLYAIRLTLVWSLMSWADTDPSAGSVDGATVDLQPEAIVTAGGGGSLTGPRAASPVFGGHCCRWSSQRWRLRRELYGPHGPCTREACPPRRIRPPGLYPHIIKSCFNPSRITYYMLLVCLHI